ncbi:hypothetical protein T03_9072, partial [Trichinella britovi]
LESEEDPNEVETFFVFLHKRAEIEARVRQDNHKHGTQDGVEIKKKEHLHSNKVLYTSVAPGNLCSICRENHHRKNMDYVFAACNKDIDQLIANAVTIRGM